MVFNFYLLAVSTLFFLSKLSSFCKWLSIWYRWSSTFILNWMVSYIFPWAILWLSFIFLPSFWYYCMYPTIFFSSCFLFWISESKNLIRRSLLVQANFNYYLKKWLAFILHLISYFLWIYQQYFNTDLWFLKYFCMIFH